MMDIPPKVRQGLAIFLFTVLGLACLCLPTYWQVFPVGKEPRLIGPDAYFHLRHVEAVASHYPVIEREDFLSAFPDKEVGLNQGFFDVGVATMSLLSGGLLTPLGALMIVSPLCLLLTGWIGYGWFLRRRGELTAGLFLLFFLLYLGPLQLIAALGHGDHHAAEVLLALLTAVGLEVLLRRETSWLWAPLCAAPMFLFYLTWPGAPLHLFIAGLIFYLRVWQPDSRADNDPHLAHKGALYGASLLLGVLAVRTFIPWGVIWVVSESLFKLATVCLVVGYPLLVMLARRPWKKPALVAVGLTVVVGLVAVATPFASQALQNLFDPRTRLIAEHIPATLAILFKWYGLLWVVALFAPVRLFWRGSWWSALVPAFYGFSLVFFWWKTYDFNYYTPPVLAAAAAYALGSFNLNRYLAGIIAVLVLSPLIPWTGVEKPWVSHSGVRELMLYSDGMESASTWLKEVQGPPKPPQDREYGMICPWDLGNVLAATADTPVGWSQTHSEELAKLLYTDNPSWAHSQMVKGERPFRYIFLPARNLAEKYPAEMFTAGLSIEEMYQKGQPVEWQGHKTVLFEPTERNKRTLLSRLYWDLGRNLGQFRLVYESPEETLHLIKLLPDGSFQLYSWPATAEELDTVLKPLLDRPRVPLETSRGVMMGAKREPEVRIFEIVPGALLTGVTQPGAAVVATLDLLAPTNQRRWSNSWSARADADGRYTLRLPYATTAAEDLNPMSVQVLGPYNVSVDGTVTSVSISEDEIQNESELELR